MAANQAASLTEDKNIIVIPTKTIPQGITALVNYIPDSTPEDNAERMGEEIQLVKTGQVTYAVRDTVIDDKETNRMTTWESVTREFFPLAQTWRKRFLR